MSHPRLAIVALLILAMSMWWAFGEPPGGTSSPNGNTGGDIADLAPLAGRVVDTSDRPVVEAHIQADGESTLTDDRGHFVFSNLSSGTYKLDAEADGHMRPGTADQGLAEVVIPPGESIQDVELVLPRASSIEGRVTDGGEPVEDADISLSYLNAEGLDTKPLSPFISADLSISDEDGRFSIGEVAPGRVQVLVESDNIFAESEEFYLRPGQEVTDIAVDFASSDHLDVQLTGELS